MAVRKLGGPEEGCSVGCLGFEAEDPLPPPSPQKLEAPNFSFPLGIVLVALFTFQADVLGCSSEPSASLRGEGRAVFPTVPHLHEGSGGFTLRTREGSGQTNNFLGP